MVGIAIDPMLAPVESLVRVIGIDYPILFGKLPLLVKWKVRGFPTTFLINKEGEIYKKYIGFRDKSTLMGDIEEALEEE